MNAAKRLAQQRWAKKSKEEIAAHMEMMRSKRWKEKTEEERKAHGEMLKNSRKKV